VLKSGTITLPPGSIPSPSGGRSSAFDFSQALMQGNPIVQKAVDDALADDEMQTSTILGDARKAVSRYLDDKPEDEASVADKFVARPTTGASISSTTPRRRKR
jgi:hypothetical protein